MRSGVDYLPITPHLHLSVVRQGAPRLNEQLALLADLQRTVYSYKWLPTEPALGMCEVCGRTGPPILRGRQILDEIFLYTV